VGVNRSIIAFSNTAATVSSSGAVGGVAGVNGRVILRTSASSGVNGYNDGPVGGIAGLNRGTIEQSYCANAHTASPVRAVGGRRTRRRQCRHDLSIVHQRVARQNEQTNDAATEGGIAGVNSGKIASHVYWKW
jgi:hypothetical protein